MGFRENLLKKIQIDQLAKQVRRSLMPADPPRRIDKEAMRALFELGNYTHRRERDLDLFLNANDETIKAIIVLDNELKQYRTTVEDVALRKSPTVKEMISIRNAIKILNDKDVVISSKSDTLQQVQDQLIAELNLSYTETDLDSLVNDGQDAFKNNYSDGVVEILTLFAELLGFDKAPKPLKLRHHHIWIAPLPSPTGFITASNIVIYDLMHNSLKMILTPINISDKSALLRYEQIASGQSKADKENEEVFAELKKMAIKKMKE